jgi:dTDP-glucose 4,6-dehydratase
MLESRNILVTGGAGFIGSHFVDMLASDNNVVVLDAITYAADLDNLSNIKCKLIQGSICDKNLVSGILKENNIDLVVNFAAESHVDNSISGPSVFIETNIVGTFNMLQSSLEFYQTLSATQQGQFRYVQISTDEVYGTLGDEGKFSDQSPIRPNSPYSASKAAGDHLARSWFETYGLPVVITNCSNNYGPRQHREKLIPRMIECAIKGQHLPVYGSGQNIRDWIFVRDHADGIIKAITKGRLGEVYCLGGDNEQTNINIVHKICELLDEIRPRVDGESYKTQIAFVEDRLGHDFRYAIDNTKSMRELGFVPQASFDNALRQTIKWYLDKYYKG